MNDLLENPYTKHRGFNQRVRVAENKLRHASMRQTRELFDRDFDDCFESGDGDAVVFQLMHTAWIEEVEYGYSVLAQGIRFLFSSNLSSDGFPTAWECIAWPQRTLQFEIAGGES